MFDILSNFTSSTEDAFPKDICTIPSKEEGVFMSDSWYECILLNTKFPEDGFMIKILKPYIWTDGKETLFAWIAENPNEYYDNMSNPIHDDDLVVVGFRPGSFDEFTRLSDGLANRILEQRSDN